jgi:hypothetical protein
VKLSDASACPDVPASVFMLSLLRIDTACPSDETAQCQLDELPVWTMFAALVKIAVKHRQDVALIPTDARSSRDESAAKFDMVDWTFKTFSFRYLTEQG